MLRRESIYLSLYFHSVKIARNIQKAVLQRTNGFHLADNVNVKVHFLSILAKEERLFLAQHSKICF